jgi:hypothetical protein
LPERVEWGWRTTPWSSLYGDPLGLALEALGSHDGVLFSRGLGLGQKFLDDNI